MKKENMFREKLYHHTMPVRDGLWEAIEAQLPPKKEQRIFPLFWFALFSTTLLGGFLMFGVFNQKQARTEADTSSKPIAVYRESQEAAPDPATQANPQTGTSETSATIGTAESGLYASTTKTNDDSDHAAGAFKKPKQKSSGTSFASTGKSAKPVTNTTSGTVYSKQELTSGNVLSTSVVQSTANTIHNSDFSILSFLPQQDIYLMPDESASGMEAPYVKPDPNCYKFSGTGSKLAFSVDVFAGPGISPKTYNENNDENSVYADARRATENNQYAWAAGARFNLQHRSGLTGRIGLNYTQAGDVFDYTDSLATQSTTRIDSFFAADGTFLYTETSQVLILGTLIKKIHNTYRYLDIPLIIGYELPMGRSTLFMNAGPVFNLTTCHEGQILDPSLHPRPITDGEPGAIDVYKSNVGMSLYLGAGFLFPLSDHFSGLVEPTYIYRLNPVTLNSYPLQEHRHYAGLHLGIRYHIH